MTITFLNSVIFIAVFLQGIAGRSEDKYALVLNQFHQPAFNRSQHSGKIVTALQYLSMFAMQHPLTLLVPVRRAFFYADLRPLCRAAKSRENGSISIHIHRIVPPVTGSDHPAVKTENPFQFPAFKADLNRISFRYRKS